MSQIVQEMGTTIIMFLLGSTLTYFFGKWSGVFKKIDALEYGVQSILRDRMCQMHKYYMAKQIPIPQREVESFENMYSAYKRLGANGYVDDIRHEIIDVMPHEPR